MPFHIEEFVFLFDGGENGFRLAIEDIILDRGESIFLHGNSGCGKSTIMNLLSGVLESDLKKQCRIFFPNIAYIMHDSTLLPWLSLEKNIKTEQNLRECKADIPFFLNLCASMGLPANVIDLMPRQLSLGMRQRVEIAKGLSFKPDLLLIDEALSGIDAKRKRIVVELIIGVARENGMTVLGTAHQVADVLMLAERVYLFESGKTVEHICISKSIEDRSKLTISERLELPEATRLMSF